MKPIMFTNEVAESIDPIVAEMKPAKVFVLTDTNTNYFVLPRLSNSEALSSAVKIVTKSGDMNKNIESLTHVWRMLAENGATRKSLLINLGGGVVTDLGGFAASTFKRGMRYINVPTTLLSGVDAAIGGKTGINFLGFKNEIGVFNAPETVVISSIFFNTLNFEEVLSGYAEMIKHALLKGDDTLNRLLAYDLHSNDNTILLSLITESVLIKKEIVDNDPTEKGIRKALNFGHTAGHAFESLAMKRKDPVPHGYAVAFGMVVELILSHFKYSFKSELLQSVAAFIKNNYGAFKITCDDYEALLKYMHHDKKNSGNGDNINFTLLTAPGDVKTDNLISENDIKQALDMYRDLFGL